MMKKILNAKLPLRLAVIVFILLLAFVCLFPFFVLPVMGSYTTEELMRMLPFWFGNSFFANTRTLLEGNFLRCYGNSIFVSFFSILGSVINSVLISYAVTKYRFKGRKFLEGLIIVTMMLPGQISTIGYIMEMRTFRLTNSLWPLVFTWLAHPFTAFFMLQFMKDSVPMEIIESGRIDGASELRVLVSLVAPFIVPAVSTVSILLFMWSWNNYMLPMLIINNNDMFTIPLYVSNLISEFRFDIGGRMAALTWAVLPVLILYVIFSKSFIKGIAAGSVKG